MKLGLDIHGVIDAKPEDFSFLSKAVIASGGEVHIITGGKWDDELMATIDAAGIFYTHVFSVYDHLMSSGYAREGKIVFPDGTVQERFADEEWDRCKADYCRENGISLHIDDTEAYMPYFDTPFMLFRTGEWEKKKGAIPLFRPE